MEELPGANIDSDHNLLAAEVQTSSKPKKKHGKNKLKCNLEKE